MTAVSGAYDLPAASVGRCETARKPPMKSTERTVGHRRSRCGGHSTMTARPKRPTAKQKTVSATERQRSASIRVWSSAKATLDAENFPTTYMTAAQLFRDAAHQALFEIYRLV